MIQYEVDENSKTVKCTISREHTIGDLIKKDARKANTSFSLAFQDEQVPKVYVGIAKYHPDEANSFSIEIGKEIARKKAFAKYYDDMKKNMSKVMQELAILQDRIRFAFFEYDSAQRDIFAVLKDY